MNVSLNKGLATVTLRPGNTVTIDQLQHAVTKNGFSTKQSNVVVSGTLRADNDRLTLRVSGSNEEFGLVAPNQRSHAFGELSGKAVTVEGVIPEVAKGKKPETIAFRSITGA